MKRFIQEYLLENWSLKATAILLALILWLFGTAMKAAWLVVWIAITIFLVTFTTI